MERKGGDWRGDGDDNVDHEEKEDKVTRLGTLRGTYRMRMLMTVKKLRGPRGSVLLYWLMAPHMTKRACGLARARACSRISPPTGGECVSERQRLFRLIKHG